MAKVELRIPDWAVGVPEAAAEDDPVDVPTVFCSR